MEDCLFALAHLQENNMIHADLRPELIAVPFKRGQNFQILDRLGDPSPPNQVQLNNFKSQKSLYMSPLVFRSLCCKQRKIKHNPFKSDVFSLGMVLLEAGLLDSVQNVYNRESADINENALVDNVERFFQRYSTSFILQEMLLIMLEFAEDLRQEPIKLLRTLRMLQKSKDQSSAQVSQGDLGVMRTIQVSENCFGIREDLMQNISFLYGISGSQKAPRENVLKRSLVEMLKSRTSHNLPPSNHLLSELRRMASPEKQKSSRNESYMSEYGIQVTRSWGSGCGERLVTGRWRVCARQG